MQDTYLGHSKLCKTLNLKNKTVGIQDSLVLESTTHHKLAIQRISGRGFRQILSVRRIYCSNFLRNAEDLFTVNSLSDEPFPCES